MKFVPIKIDSYKNCEGNLIPFVIWIVKLKKQDQVRELHKSKGGFSGVNFINDFGGMEKLNYNHNIFVCACPQLEVCIPELLLNETRQDGTRGHFPNWGDHDKLLVNIPEKTGKKWDGTGLLVPIRKFLISTELQDFSRNFF